MLSKLHISNYAIIREVELNFSHGLNIITGETGAGKSILVGALGLILGDRADTSVMADTTRKCTVEGHFAHDHRETIRQFFEAHDLELDEEIILRREIAGNGKSRAFINDTPVNLTQLQELANLLVDLHQQFDNLDLGRNRFQMDMLDALAGQIAERATFNTQFQAFAAAREKLRNLEAERESSVKEYDYYSFLLSELDEAAFREGEIEAMEADAAVLENAEQITGVLARTHQLIEADEQAIAGQLKSIIHLLEGISRFQAEAQPLAERIRSAQIELKDIAAEAEQIASRIHADPARRDQLADRLSLAYRLLKKHQVKDTEGLLQVQHDLRHRVSRVANMDEAINTLQKEVDKLRSEALLLAGKLSEKRKKIIPVLEGDVQKLLVRVGMPNAKLRIDLSAAEMNATGVDAVEFLFDANKSGKFEPLRKVASGGEFSRLLLCVKTLVAGSLSMPVMIFDEIDTGISGEAAKQVGILMKEMGNAHQVISITHQPQIAARADAHFFVYKKEIDGQVQTRLRKLSEEERVDAIARMMSGENPSESAKSNARELIGGKA